MMTHSLEPRLHWTRQRRHFPQVVVSQTLPETQDFEFDSPCSPTVNVPLLELLRPNQPHTSIDKLNALSALRPLHTMNCPHMYSMRKLLRIRTPSETSLSDLPIRAIPTVLSPPALTYLYISVGLTSPSNPYTTRKQFGKAKMPVSSLAELQVQKQAIPTASSPANARPAF